MRSILGSERGETAATLRKTFVILSIAVLSLFLGQAALSHHMGYPDDVPESVEPRAVYWPGVLASGTKWGRDYALYAYTTAQGFCLHLDMKDGDVLTDGSAGGCGYGVPDEQLISYNLSQYPALGGTVIFGPVTKLAASVKVKVSTGSEITASTLAGPTGLPDFFLVTIDAVVDIEELRAYSATNQLLAEMIYA